MTHHNNHETPPAAPATPPPGPRNDINYFGLTNFRNQYRKFGIKTDDRLRHVYIIGKSGMGKSVLLENMVLNDIYAGQGVGVIDPHGDFAEKVVDCIPPHRVKDVVYFNPCDLEFPVGFNILESVQPDRRHLVVSGLSGVFKKIWPDVWSARMDNILINTLFALLEYPNTTLMSVTQFLADKEYYKKVVDAVKDPSIKAFWEKEYASWNDKYKQEAIAPIQNKIGQFLAASIIRNIVAQPKSTINIREIMDSQKIFVVNLSKGRIGEDNSRLLGAMIVTKVYLSALERVDIKKAEDRKPFFLYVDEFQNFATESFANILSEARKYGLSLTVAHQYMKQLDETVLDAIIGNVGTMISFRVGSGDSEILAKEFAPTFVEEDMINLPKYQIYLKLLIDGVASRPFSAATLPPVFTATDNTPAVVAYAHEHYTSKRSDVENAVAEMSGLVVASPAIDPSEGSDDESIYIAPRPPLSRSNERSSNGGGSSAPRRDAPPRSSNGGSSGGNYSSRSGQSSGSSGDRSRPPRQGAGSSSAGSGRSSGSDRRPAENRSADRPRTESAHRAPQQFQNPKPPLPQNAEKVLLVDPAQKGISLQSIMPKHDAKASEAPSEVPSNRTREPQRSLPPRNQGVGRGDQRSPQPAVSSQPSAPSTNSVSRPSVAPQAPAAAHPPTPSTPSPSAHPPAAPATGHRDSDTNSLNVF